MTGIDVGTRMTNNANIKGKVVEYRKSHNRVGVVIEWDVHGKVGYTEAMLNDALDSKIIGLDREYYRNEKLDDLGI